MFRTKKDEIDVVVRYKRRLIAKKYSWITGINFNESCGHIVKFNTIKIIVAIGIAIDLKINQMDVKTAFLNGKL